MSNPAINWAWKQKHLPSVPHFVPVSIADRASEAGICWPSNRDRRERTGYTGDKMKPPYSRQGAAAKFVNIHRQTVFDPAIALRLDGRWWIVPERLRAFPASRVGGGHAQD